MTFKDRIIQPAGYQCPVVILNDDEKQFYRGCGNALAKVVNGQIVELIYDYESIPDNDEYWTGMLSCYEFCEPQPAS